MQSLSELALYDLPMAETAFSENPWPHLAAAREMNPWVARCEFGHAIICYQAMRDLLCLDCHMTGAYADIVETLDAHGTPWGRHEEESLLATTGSTHDRIRAVLAPAFTPQQANRHRPLMRRVIGELLDEWAPKGAFDFEEFASYFPITVMCNLIGASPSALPQLKSSMEDFGLSMSMDRAHLPALQKATLTLEAFIAELLSERRANRKPAGEDDLLEILVRNQENGDISERELWDLLIVLFVAGYDTSKNALTLMMDVLMDRPDLYRRCAEDHGFCKKVVEENFRFLTTSTIPRRVTREIVYRDVLIPEGTMLFFPISISGRDPDAFVEPATFDPEREWSRKPITFGQGVHICLGQFIARAQIEEGLHLIAQRIAKPQRTGPSGWRPFYGVWGLRGLPIKFDPAPALELAD